MTGASRGIGLDLTKQLRELPSSQVGRIFAFTREPKTTELQEVLTNNPGRVTHVHAAVGDAAGVKKAAEEVDAKLNGLGLDVPVNNASAMAYTSDGTSAMPSEQLSHVLNVNVTGPHNVTTAFLPLSPKRRPKESRQCVSARAASVCNIISAKLIENASRLFRESAIPSSAVVGTLELQLDSVYCRAAASRSGNVGVITAAWPFQKRSSGSLLREYLCRCQPGCVSALGNGRIWVGKWTQRQWPMRASFA